MGNNSVIEDICNGKLQALHTAYVAKVIEVSGTTAKIQPLSLTNSSGQLINTSVTAHFTTAAEEMQNGDIVVCVVCDRNIARAVRGENTSTSAVNHHNIGDTIIVGVLKR